MTGGCEGVAAVTDVAVSAGSGGSEGGACWFGGWVEVGAAGEGEAMSAGRLQMRIARATIKTTNQGLRGSTYFITDGDFHDAETGFPACSTHYMRAFCPLPYNKPSPSILSPGRIFYTVPPSDNLLCLKYEFQPTNTCGKQS